MKKNPYGFDMMKDGISYSMIASWLQCREQCRLRYIEGYRAYSGDEFTGLDFGSAVHWVLDKVMSGWLKNGIANGKTPNISPLIDEYTEEWRKEMGTARLPENMEQEHEKMMGLVEVMTRQYFKRVLNSKDKLWNDRNREWKWVEKEFSFPVLLPNGANVRIVGKMDGGFKDDKGRTVLLETKNYSVIDPETLGAGLHLDLQVMLYVTGLWQRSATEKLGGVLYNVIRRPGHRPKANESLHAFLKRVEGEVESDPDHFFHRFPSPLTRKEVELWYHRQLVPILTEMTEWIDAVQSGDMSRHYHNPLSLTNKYGRSEFFDAIVTGSVAGLSRRERAHTELTI